MHLPCSFRILCSLPLTSNNLPIATMPLVDIHQAYSGLPLVSNDDDTLLYFSCKDVEEIQLPCLQVEASQL
jgi:hypothetical protein